jgi:hypothetical protein
MATIIEFPANAASRRSRSGASREAMGTIVILPVVRIERETTTNTTSDDRGPREGTAQSRRRRRR